MTKKLQVFISSTFIDLQEERQAAVEAVLNSGHIPAGMELFKAGDESQKETIKRWIQESDCYMLILGGRYGTIEESSGKSYTHWEYDFAGELGKPRFAVVIEESALEDKIKHHGSTVTERANYQRYIDFRKFVLSKTSKFFSDIKDIKLTILESLKDFERNDSLDGWVSGKDQKENQKMLNKNLQLMEENNKLKEKIQKLEEKVNKQNEISGYSFEEILQYLHTVNINIPEALADQIDRKEVSLFEMFYLSKDTFATGVTNQYGMKEMDRFLFFRLAPKLMPFSLLEKAKLAGVKYERIQLSKIGLKFWSMYEMKTLRKKQEKLTS